MARLALILSSEHASARIPERYAARFRGHRALLASHRGSDLGSLDLGRHLGRAFGVKLSAGRFSRLVVDLNRSAHHPGLWSAVTRALPPEERQEILRRIHAPYRDEVEERVRVALEKSARVLHLSVHSFTPVLDGRVRNAEVGLLYDPSRPRELSLCRALQGALRSRAPELRVRRNYPYRGRADGLVTTLRKRFSPARYLGVELEVNQALLGSRARWKAVQGALTRSLEDVLGKVG